MISGLFSKKKSPCLIFSVFVFIFSFSILSFAEGSAVKCVLTNENVGNGYEYKVPGVGSFIVNAREGEEAAAVLFSMDSKCRGKLFKDGEEVFYNGSMIVEPGSYEMKIYPVETAEEIYGSFLFKVNNELKDTLTSISKDFKIIEDPPLSLIFDRDEHIFRYVLPDGRYFDTTVPLGGWTKENVEINLSQGLNIYQVYYNDEPVDDSKNLSFKKSGKYEAVILDNEMGMDGDKGYKIHMSFNIYDNEALPLSLINAPEGLEIGRCYHRGKPLEADGSYLLLKSDGSYRIEFETQEGITAHIMEFKRDTSPPSLNFDIEITDKIYENEINFTMTDPSDSLYIYRNGEKAEASLNKIAAMGKYHIEVVDKAGNVREYNFILKSGIIFDLKPLVIILVIAVLSLGVASYIYWHRNLKVL